ncbi:MAG: hypothetical protein ACPLRZ_06580 [Thermovenabulum sp.]
MYYFRFDGNILDFTNGPATDKIMKLANNYFYIQLPIPDPLTWNYLNFRY